MEKQSHEVEISPSVLSPLPPPPSVHFPTSLAGVKNAREGYPPLDLTPEEGGRDDTETEEMDRTGIGIGIGNRGVWSSSVFFFFV